LRLNAEESAGPKVKEGRAERKNGAYHEFNEKLRRSASGTTPKGRVAARSREEGTGSGSQGEREKTSETWKSHRRTDNQRLRTPRSQKLSTLMGGINP